MDVTIGRTLLRLVQGDITQQETDAIVNAANSELAGGGGVDGAIHRAGGPVIYEECARIRKERGRLPAGQAVITAGGRLKAKYVIHTVGPVWHGGTHGEEETLASAYRSSLKLATEHGLRTVAFPSISTGAYGFPVERAARVALRAVKDFLVSPMGRALDEVLFVLFSSRDLEAYEKALADIHRSA